MPPSYGSFSTAFSGGSEWRPKSFRNAVQKNLIWSPRPKSFRNSVQMLCKEFQTQKMLYRRLQTQSGWDFLAQHLALVVVRHRVVYCLANNDGDRKIILKSSHFQAKLE